jgi:hypothetical protein
MHRRPLALLAALLVVAIAPATASAWAPAATAKIHPGVMTFTGGAQCTANFIYTAGTDTFIGQAAHCSGTGAATDTNGCTAQSLPEGTAVQVDGAANPGTMVYNSWIRMQSSGESDPATCAFNDLALVKLNPADVAKVNPSIPFWGGPQGIGKSVTGKKVYSYGNSSLRLGLSPLSPKIGAITLVDPSGWSYNLYTATPGIPGDSGSAFLNTAGAALGVLSTVEAAPLPASNNIGSIAKELAWARAHGFGVNLVNGTQPFKPLV